MSRIGRLVRAVCAATVLAATFAAHTDAAPKLALTPKSLSPVPVPVPAPDVAVRNFYNWYLAQLVANKDPFRDDKAGLKRYVSERLLTEIQRKIDSPDGLDDDYFIQTQDYMDDWVNHITAVPTRTLARLSVVSLVLGADSTQPWHLTVTMQLQADGWKVYKVRHLGQ